MADDTPAAGDRPKTLTISLSEPVEYKGKTYTSLTFRRRKAKDLVAMELVKGAHQQHMAMLASMAGVPLPVILEMDAEDFEDVNDKTVIMLGERTAKTVRDLRQAQEPETPASSE